MSEKQTTQRIQKRKQEELSEGQESLIRLQEERIAAVRRMNLMDDVFMRIVLNDTAACQHVLRILTGIPDLVVKEVRVQHRISKLASHDAVLDVLAEDSRKVLYNLEIQRRDTVDHARRTRFYGSMIDSEYLQKGFGYHEMPEVHIIYLSRTDLWKAGKCVYPVKKYFEGTDLTYEDGIHITYVNATVDDGSEIARLMQYFVDSDPKDMSHGALSERVSFMKQEGGGRDMLDPVLEELVEEGRQEGRQEYEKEMVIHLRDMGFPLDQIAAMVRNSVSFVQEVLDQKRVAKP